MNSASILIVDDDLSVIASLALLLKQAGYRTRTAGKPAEALDQVERESFDLVLQDMNFSRQTTGEEGMALLAELKRRRPDLPVVMMTAWGSIELAVRGIKAGAVDFITKPWTNEQLLQDFWVPLDLIRTGAELIEERDFTSKFLEVGQPEMDQLIRIYNRMIDQLREERTRLQEQHYFMDKILANAPSGIVTLDFDGRIALVNPSGERMLQRDGEELVGKKFEDIPSGFVQSLSEIEVGESRVLPLHGRRRVLCHRGQFLDQGFRRGYILMEELTEELRQSEKMAYEKVIRLLSHEVNNSIGGVNSLLHSCLNYKDQLSEEDRGDFENALQVAITRTEALNVYMKSYAEVIRLPPPRLQPVVLKELLQDIELLMGAESQERQVEWVWDEEAPLDAIPLDKGQMEQVFVNILKNALEAIGERGTIIVHLGRRNHRPWVVVEDTGGGIPPEIKAQLFTPFFSTKENGQGIGLTMIQEILSRHRCEFSLESEPGKGARFEILFA